MDEQTQQPAPEEPKKEQTAQEKSLQNRGYLEKLPPPIRKELDDWIVQKNPNAARKYMIAKYGEQFPILKEIGKPSWYGYAKKYSLQSGMSKELKADVVSTTPALETAIEKIADTTVSITDKKAALMALYNDCAETSKRLEGTQTNFVDPQIQAVILANRKQMCTIVEKLSVLNDQLSKDSDKDWLAEIEYIMQVCVMAVVSSYKLVHTDQSNFAKFMTDFRNRLIDLIKSYRATKETLKKDPVKI